MLDVGAPVLRQQRVNGRAAVTITANGRVGDLVQAGSAKAMLPRMHGAAPEIVFLNTAGGITGGDRLDYGLDLAAGAVAVGTTQTAERAYRSAGGVGRVTTRLRVGAGACLMWLPQEVIVFEGAALERDLTVEMATQSEAVILETLVLGRAAMGETLSQVHLRDRRRVLRDGRLEMLEAVRLDADDLSRAGVAGLNGARAVASLTLMAENAQDRLAALRAVLPCADDAGGVRAAASAWEGRLTARFTAPDGWPLRRAVARAVEALTRRPLPRVWQI